MNNEEIEQAKDGLKLQRFWPHQDDIAEDATRALAAIEELKARYAMMSTLADVTASNAADQIEELLSRNQALAELVERMTSKCDYEEMIDLKMDNERWRSAMAKVEQIISEAAA